MNKRIYAVCLLIIMAAALGACGKKTGLTSPNTVVSKTYSTTEPKYTAGKPETSERLNMGEDEYELMYYDESGVGVKLEHYRKGRLRYYYVCSAVDSDGNCLRQSYYKASGKLLGVFEDGYFFDAEGNQITEDMMEVMLDKVE